MERGKEGKRDRGKEGKRERGKEGKRERGREREIITLRIDDDDEKGLVKKMLGKRRVSESGKRASESESD